MLEKVKKLFGRCFKVSLYSCKSSALILAKGHDKLESRVSEIESELKALKSIIVQGV